VLVWYVRHSTNRSRETLANFVYSRLRSSSTFPGTAFVNCKVTSYQFFGDLIDHSILHYLNGVTQIHCSRKSTCCSHKKEKRFETNTTMKLLLLLLTSLNLAGADLFTFTPLRVNVNQDMNHSRIAVGCDGTDNSSSFVYKCHAPFQSDDCAGHCGTVCPDNATIHDSAYTWELAPVPGGITYDCLADGQYKNGNDNFEYAIGCGINNQTEYVCSSWRVGSDNSGIASGVVACSDILMSKCGGITCPFDCTPGTNVCANLPIEYFLGSNTGVTQTNLTKGEIHIAPPKLVFGNMTFKSWIRDSAACAVVGTIISCERDAFNQSDFVHCMRTSTNALIDYRMIDIATRKLLMTAARFTGDNSSIFSDQGFKDYKNVTTGGQMVRLPARNASLDSTVGNFSMCQYSQMLTPFLFLISAIFLLITKNKYNKTNTVTGNNKTVPSGRGHVVKTNVSLVYSTCAVQ
jgi:hypothetical protein